MAKPDVKKYAGKIVNFAEFDAQLFAVEKEKTEKPLGHIGKIMRGIKMSLAALAEKKPLSDPLLFIRNGAAYILQREWTKPGSQEENIYAPSRDDTYFEAASMIDMIKNSYSKGLSRIFAEAIDKCADQKNLLEENRLRPVDTYAVQNNQHGFAVFVF